MILVAYVCDYLSCVTYVAKQSHLINLCDLPNTADITLTYVFTKYTKGMVTLALHEITSLFQLQVVKHDLGLALKNQSYSDNPVILAVERY